MQHLVKKTKLFVGQAVVRQLVARGIRRTKDSGCERIIVAGLFSTASGIGESARLCKAGLDSENVDVEALDLSWVFNQQDMRGEVTYSQTLKRPETGGTLIIHLNAPETMIALWKMGLFRQHRNWRIIGYWAWELETLPESWNTGFQYLSEIWVPSEFVKGAVSAATELQVKVVPHAVQIPKLNRNKKSIETLTFLTMGDGLSSFERKNILGSIKAYLIAFPEAQNAKLIVKCRNQHRSSTWLKTAKSYVRGREDIEFLLDNLSTREMDELTSNADVLISLHRSEGFGLPIAEAIAKNKYVICTGWSGNMEFTNARNACIVNFKKTALVDPYGVYTGESDLEWVDPDIDHAAHYMRDIYDRPEFYRQKFDKHQNTLIPKLSAKNYLKALGTPAT